MMVCIFKRLTNIYLYYINKITRCLVESWTVKPTVSESVSIKKKISQSLLNSIFIPISNHEFCSVLINIILGPCFHNVGTPCYYNDFFFIIIRVLRLLENTILYFVCFFFTFLIIIYRSPGTLRVRLIIIHSRNLLRMRYSIAAKRVCICVRACVDAHYGFISGLWARL